MVELSRFPRLNFAHLPTPLEPMENLTRELGGPNIWVKRDDCTGLATGGNKTRKLEFLMADALEKGADTIITQGATQSNHARQTVAIASKLGMECHILLEDRTGSEKPNYNCNGNVLLDLLLGGQLSRRPGGADMDAEMADLAERLRGRGRKPYIIPGGGSNEIGALGYVDAAFEIVEQAAAMRLRIDHIVHATGSTGTQAGLVTGLQAAGGTINLLGISVRAPRPDQEENIFKLARKVCNHIGQPDLVQREHVVANGDYVGPGYGLPTDGMIEAVIMIARREAILLDPVYSGKGMAGLIDLIRKGRFGKEENVVFVHTGGSAALFGYPDVFSFPDYRRAPSESVA